MMTRSSSTSKTALLRDRFVHVRAVAELAFGCGGGTLPGDRALRLPVGTLHFTTAAELSDSHTQPRPASVHACASARTESCVHTRTLREASGTERPASPPSAAAGRRALCSDPPQQTLTPAAATPAPYKRSNALDLPSNSPESGSGLPSTPSRLVCDIGG